MALGAVLTSVSRGSLRLWSSNWNTTGITWGLIQPYLAAPPTEFWIQWVWGGPANVYFQPSQVLLVGDHTWRTADFDNQAWVQRQSLPRPLSPVAETWADPAIITVCCCPWGRGQPPRVRWPQGACSATPSQCVQDRGHRLPRLCPRFLPSGNGMSTAITARSMYDHGCITCTHTDRPRGEAMVKGTQGSL